MLRANQVSQEEKNTASRLQHNSCLCFQPARACHTDVWTCQSWQCHEQNTYTHTNAISTSSLENPDWSSASRENPDWSKCGGRHPGLTGSGLQYMGGVVEAPQIFSLGKGG